MPTTRSLSLDETRVCWRYAQKQRRTYDEDVMLHAIQDRCPHDTVSDYPVRRCADCAAALDPKGKRIVED